MANTKKTDRKNKTNLTVTWPTSTSYFNIKDLSDKNPDFIKITLRVRLKNALEDGTVTQIGTIPGGKGRPQLAFAMSPVTESALASARTAGVVLNEKYEMVNVVEVKASTESAEVTETVATEKTSDKSVVA